MVPPTSRKVPRVSRYSGSCRPQNGFVYGAFTLSGHLSMMVPLPFSVPFAVLNPVMPGITVWALSLSLAATQEIDVSFSSSGYLDVSVPRVPLHTLCIGVWIRKVSLRGFPHSDICGSLGMCPSPQLFAACHVFLRLLVPRHPPCALIRLTFVI